MQRDRLVERGAGALLVGSDGDQILILPIERQMFARPPGQGEFLGRTDVAR